MLLLVILAFSPNHVDANDDCDVIDDDYDDFNDDWDVIDDEYDDANAMVLE